MSILQASINDDLKALKECVISGDIDEQDKDTGFTALHFCAQNGNVEMVKLLLDHGASVKIKDNYGNTALFKAVFFSGGQMDIIKMLLNEGADPDAENDAGVSPRQLAENIAAFDISETFR